MQNKKNLILIGVALFLIAAGIFVILKFSQTPLQKTAQAPQAQTNTAPSSGANQQTQAQQQTAIVNTTLGATAPEKLQNSAKVTFQTPKGDVLVNNFFRGYTRTQGTSYTPIILAKSAAYNETYNFEGNYFGIVLILKPVVQYRQQAEQAFIQALGINQIDACKLPVLLQISSSIDNQLGGNLNFGLSFCPDSVNIKNLHI